MPAFISAEMKAPAAAAITLTGSPSGSENGATITRPMPYRVSIIRSISIRSVSGAAIVIRTSLRRRASASIRTTITRLMPNCVAMSFCVQPSTWYSHTARARSRSVSLWIPMVGCADGMVLPSRGSNGRINPCDQAHRNARHPIRAFDLRHMPRVLHQMNSEIAASGKGVPIMGRGSV